jgi:catechol 2,3-dioxygenase-like lactoylglutathione lyase family enzyme
MAALVPELYCTDIKKSIAFYTEHLGFKIKYERPEEGFAYIFCGDAEIMLEELEKNRNWISGPLEYPFGRGINLQIEIADIENLYENLKKLGAQFFLDIEDKNYQCGPKYLLSRQFIVIDPDGYLLRFFKDIG